MGCRLAGCHQRARMVYCQRAHMASYEVSEYMALGRAHLRAASQALVL